MGVPAAGREGDLRLRNPCVADRGALPDFTTRARCPKCKPAYTHFQQPLSNRAVELSAIP